MQRQNKKANRLRGWLFYSIWWAPGESNPAPTDYESAALTKHELGAQEGLHCSGQNHGQRLALVAQGITH